MTEDEALLDLLKLLDGAKKVSLDLENNMSWSTPEPRSSLAGDDAKTIPYQLSHCVYHAMMTSLDHLHCLRSSLFGQKSHQELEATIHMSAQFTLARGGLENASRAIWVLSPASRVERIRRRLALQKKEYIDTGKLIKNLGGDSEEWVSERVAKVEAVAWASGVPRINPQSGKPEKLKPLNYGDMVKEAAKAVGKHATGAKAVWQLASGLSHGDMSATLNVLDKEAVCVPSEGVQMLKVTGSIEQLRWFSGTSCEMLHEALLLFKGRGSRNI